MSTPVLDVRTLDGLREGVLRAAAVLRAGGLVAFPTETVYGLGAHALDADAVRRIFDAKGRPATNPVIVHAADAAAARRLAASWPDRAERLAERFWPGPLTLVVARSATVPDVVTAGGPTVALRVPAHPVALALLREAGLPIAAPSANRSSRLSPTRAEHLLRDLGGRIDLILDGGATQGGIESTVVDVTRDPPRLLRPGLITVTSLEAELDEVTRGGADEAGALPSPGMLARHYSPQTPLEVVEEVEARARELIAKGRRVAVVSHGAVEAPGAIVLRLPDDPGGYGRALYATLHDLDALGLDRILVAAPPDGEGWLAIRDRLRRAAT
jgi:L-threonylcarbamoyladenylate synthase